MTIPDIKRKLKSILKNGCIVGMLMASALLPEWASANNLCLHYDRPAEFFEEALVIGNGKIGAIVYGGSDSERIALNDITLWTGMPEKCKASQTDAEERTDHSADLALIRGLLDKEDYAGAEIANKKLQGHYSENYQPLGNIEIRYNNRGVVADYHRQLDISEALATVSYLRDSRKLSREYFVSAPDSVIVMRIKGNEILDFELSFNSLLPYEISASDRELTVDGYTAYHSYPGYYSGLEDKDKHLYDKDKGIHFRTVVKVLAPSSRVTTSGSSLKVSGGKEAVIVVANETSFNGFDKDPVKEGKDYKRIVAGLIERASRQEYDDMKRRHIDDYQKYFNRVELDLGETASEIKSLPTDAQLRLYTEQSQHNPELEALYFQYGRYLLISCSRTPGVPANLQGLWNEKLLPPWSCNYTSNINLEENYWLAENTNLMEMHLPLMDFISNLAENGSKTAKDFYGVDEGWCLAHNTDIWAMTCPVGLQSGDPMWACWNMGGAWVASHIWNHFLYTQDKDFLLQYYDVLKGAADFCLGWLIEKDGYLMTSPGTSPENRFFTPDRNRLATSYGTTSDNAMIRQCLIDAVAAAKVLGRDKAFIDKAEATIAKLPPYKIGKNGQLQEWYVDWDDEDPHHRHQSHLYGLFPGTHIDVNAMPDIAEACHKTLAIRGPESTGWSTGWRVNLYARLRDSDMAYSTYRKLLKYISPDNYNGDDAIRGGGTYPNLLDAHSPFQIDGNFGGAAGVAEMLLQSTPGSITLLPALPDNWKEGSVKGLRAKGGFTVDISWRAGKVTEFTVKSDVGGDTSVNVDDKIYELHLEKDEKTTVCV